MHKKILITLIIVVVVIGTIGYILSKRSTLGESDGGTGSNQQPGGSDKKITYETNSGYIQVRNFYDKPVRRVPGETVVEENKDFSISSFDDYGSFAIAITSEPVKENRRRAEQAFLKDLGISKQDACKLKVQLEVSYKANSRLAGPNYGLSFCADGKDF